MLDQGADRRRRADARDRLADGSEKAAKAAQVGEIANGWGETRRPPTSLPGSKFLGPIGRATELNAALNRYGADLDRGVPKDEAFMRHLSPYMGAVAGGAAMGAWGAAAGPMAPLAVPLGAAIGGEVGEAAGELGYEGYMVVKDAVGAALEPYSTPLSAYRRMSRGPISAR